MNHGFSRPFHHIFSQARGPSDLILAVAHAPKICYTCLFCSEYILTHSQATCILCASLQLITCPCVYVTRGCIAGLTNLFGTENYFLAGLRSRKESEVFGWSRIPNNNGSRSRIFLSDSGSPIGSFFTSHS